MYVFTCSFIGVNEQIVVTESSPDHSDSVMGTSRIVSHQTTSDPSRLWDKVFPVAVAVSAFLVVVFLMLVIKMIKKYCWKDPKPARRRQSSSEAHELV